MRNKLAGFIGIVAAVLTIGLGTAVETNHAMGPQGGVRTVVADGQTPTGIVAATPTPTTP